MFYTWLIRTIGKIILSFLKAALSAKSGFFDLVFAGNNLVIVEIRQPFYPLENTSLGVLFGNQIDINFRSS